MSPLTNILIKQLACTAPVPSPLSPLLPACCPGGGWTMAGTPAAFQGHAVMLGAEALVMKPQERAALIPHTLAIKSAPD